MSNPNVTNALQKLSSTYDDDDASFAVDALVREGGAAVKPLCAMLTVATLTQRGGECDPGERQGYVLKALRRIGDDAAFVPALRMYAELERFIETTDNPNYKMNLVRYLQPLVDLARELDPGGAASIPASVSTDRDGCRASVDAILSKYD